MQGYYEATAEQKELANIGRMMIDFSEYYPNLKGMKEAAFKTLNDISTVGTKLTSYGTTWGAKITDFSEYELKLIDGFMKKELDIQN